MRGIAFSALIFLSGACYADLARAEQVLSAEVEKTISASIMVNNVVVKPVTEDDRGTYVPVTVFVRNLSNKTISGFKGMIRHTDQFGDVISTIDFVSHHDLPAGLSADITSYYDPVGGVLKVQNISSNKISWEAFIYHVVFYDGTELKYK